MSVSAAMRFRGARQQVTQRGKFHLRRRWGLRDIVRERDLPSRRLSNLLGGDAWVDCW